MKVHEKIIDERIGEKFENSKDSNVKELTDTRTWKISSSKVALLR